jgi:hypothetical protein
MRIKELLEAVGELPVQPTPAEMDAEIQAVTDFAKSVEVSQEPAPTVLNKFSTFLAAHPLFDLVTDYIPQTRAVKALIGAADALEQKDGKSALASLSSLVTGAAGKAIDAGSRVASVAGTVDDYNTTTQTLAQK